MERHPRGYVHSLYGSTSLFLYPGVDKVILSLDLSAGTFTFAAKSSIIAELQLRHEDELLDLGLLAGWDRGSTFPPLADGTFGPPLPATNTTVQAHSAGVDGAGMPLSPDHKPVDLRQAVGIMRAHRGAIPLVHTFSEHPLVKSRHYLDESLRSKTMLKYSMIVRAEDGAVVPLPHANVSSLPNVAANGNNGPQAAAMLNGVGSVEIPGDLSEVFSNRLPDEIFLHLSRGLVSPQVHTWLASGHLVQLPPLCNGKSAEYRRFVRDTLTESPSSPSCVALALATSTLHPSWQTSKVNAVYWWNPQQQHPIPFDSQVAKDLVAKVHNWNVPVSFVEEELRRQNSSTIDIALCLGATGTNELANRTKTPRKTGQGHALEKKDEIVANVIWRMLEVRGFLNHDHLHASYARALHLGIRTARLNDKLQEPLYLALELIRAGVLSAQKYRKPSESSGAPPTEPLELSGGPDTDTLTEADQKSELLLLRTFSLLPMQFKPEAWSQPVSMELLVFNSFVRAMGRSMRQLVEMIASTMLLCGDAKRARDDHLDIALSLPFQTDTNTGLGILLKCYIEGFLAYSGAVPTSDDVSGKNGQAKQAEIKEYKDSILDILEESFINVRSVRMELQRGFRFWDSIMIAVRSLAENDGMSKEATEEFLEAEKWLEGFRF